MRDVRNTKVTFDLKITTPIWFINNLKKPLGLKELLKRKVKLVSNFFSLVLDYNPILSGIQLVTKKHSFLLRSSSELST